MIGINTVIVCGFEEYYNETIKGLSFNVTSRNLRQCSCASFRNCSCSCRGVLSMYSCCNDKGYYS